jgi:hypothetical protein
MFAVIGRPVLRPKLTKGLEILVGQAAPSREGYLQQGKLFLHPARARADDQASMRQHIDGREQLGSKDRRTMGHDQHRGQQAQAFRDAGEEGDGCELLEAMPVLGCAERTAGRIGVGRLEVRRHDDVVAN